MRIAFAEKTQFDSLGRNGYILTHGVEVSKCGDDVHLEPINSRGDIGRARVSVPIAHVYDLIAALSSITKTP